MELRCREQVWVNYVSQEKEEEEERVGEGEG